jgi:hypothetical protein
MITAERGLGLGPGRRMAGGERSMPDGSNARTQDAINELTRCMAAAIPVAEAGKPVLGFQDFHVTFVGGSQCGPTSVDAQVISQHDDNVHVQARLRSSAGVLLAYAAGRLKPTGEFEPRPAPKKRGFLRTLWEVLEMASA